MINVRNNQLGEKTIDIDINKTVTITLRNEDYDELISKLELSMAEKVKSGDIAVQNSYKRRTKCFELVKDIREIFYDMTTDGEFAWKKELGEIEEKKLTDVLNKYNRFLGFQ